MLELKRNLSQESFTQVMHALQVYKSTDNLTDLVEKAADRLIVDGNTHDLLRGLSACTTCQLHKITHIPQTTFFV